MGAVSYTHLDVYKRQVNNMTPVVHALNDAHSVWGESTLSVPKLTR